MSQQQIERVVLEWLAANAAGWSIQTDREHRPAGVHLQHEASHGLALDWTELSDGEVGDWVLRALSNSEEISIAAAAPPLTHRDFTLGLRTLAGVFSWNSQQAQSLAFLLYEFGHLTEAETEWFAGWIGADAPRRSVNPRRG